MTNLTSNLFDLGELYIIYIKGMLPVLCTFNTTEESVLTRQTKSLWLSALKRQSREILLEIGLLMSYKVQSTAIFIRHLPNDKNEIIKYPYNDWEILQLIHLKSNALQICPTVEFRDNNVSCVYWGRKQRRFNCHFIRLKDSGESPLLPSPSSQSITMSFRANPPISFTEI